MSQASPLWNEIISKPGWSLDHFRRPGEINSRLAAWEPRELSLRWYRSFLNLAFSSASDMVKDEYAELSSKLNYGDPVTNAVNHKGKRITINLDYLMAFEDVEFLRPVHQVDIESVLEVGAGFGRLAHLLLLRLKSIKTYYIVDLPQVLNLSKAYLWKVLPQTCFEKLCFILPDQIPELVSELPGVNLAIQVDGLQEMTSESLDKYFSVFSNSQLFFSKNVVAKYLPSHAGLEGLGPNVALTLGRSLELCDIWNTSDLESCYLKHLDYYRPKLHDVKTSSPDRLFPHYCNILYERKV